MKNYRTVALFSGGLDSILAVRLMQEQGWEVICLHFFSPFFGRPDLADSWRETYGIRLECVDVSHEYVAMLLQGPEFGLGKFLNPCVDCKIFMFKQAKKYMLEFGARLIITGEVLGQRPMSQRRGPLHLIQNRSKVKDILLRPMSAGLLEPTTAEKEGDVDREKLLSVSGRGRKDQLEMAREMGIEDVPTPGGGCLLTQAESAKRYLPLLEIKDHVPEPGDFRLANVGRQFWSGDFWLCIGRDKQDNERLEEIRTDGDYLFFIRQFPGPLGIGRPFGREWPEDMLKSAAAWVCRFAPKARKSLRTVEVEVSRMGVSRIFHVWPEDWGSTDWQEPQWSARKKQAFLERFKENTHGL
jgi:hypothetical protein